jgi:hypothetical protein
MSHRKKVQRTGFLVRALPLLILLLSGSCKWGPPDYSLTVIVEDGVTGTPEAGKYSYQELTTVQLNYTPVNPLNTVEVMLNGDTRKTGISSLIMYGDGYRVTARLVDIRGSWKITLTNTDTSIAAPDPFVITISGPDLASGTFSDGRGYHGTWSATASSLTLAYWDWNFYVLSGTVFNMGYSSGTFSGAGLTGTWSATRQD